MRKEMTVENENSVGDPKDNDSNTEVPRLKVYKRRWLILSIICSIISVRSFNQSCYGPINNILSGYFQVHPWQIDWLNATHPLVFLVLSLPMLLVSTKLGFRVTATAMGVLETVSYFLVALGVSWRTTFPVAVIGQVTMGLSTIISSSIPPATAAIWFPKNEVATVVAMHLVARGTGEAIGCVVPNLVLKNSFTPDDVGKSLVYMFSVLTTISFCLTVAAFLVVRSEPFLPPSEAQAKIREASNNETNQESAFTKFSSTLKKLFKNKAFVLTCIGLGMTNSIYRTNTVLFTSILRENFFKETSVNIQSGVALLIGWILYIVGSFICGPLITKTKAYKGLGVFAFSSLMGSCVLILVGLKVKVLKLSFSGIVLQGFFSGMSKTALYELLTEIIYPISPMSAYKIVLVLTGFFMLLYILVGRLLLSYAGPLSSMGLSIAIAGFGLIAIIITKPTYFREQANETSNEETPLVDSAGKK